MQRRFGALPQQVMQLTCPQSGLVQADGRHLFDEMPCLLLFACFTLQGLIPRLSADAHPSAGPRYCESRYLCLRDKAVSCFCQRGAKVGVHHFDDSFEELGFDFRFSQLLLKFFNMLFGRQGSLGMLPPHFGWKERFASQADRICAASS